MRNQLSAPGHRINLAGRNLQQPRHFRDGEEVLCEFRFVSKVLHSHLNFHGIAAVIGSGNTKAIGMAGSRFVPLVSGNHFHQLDRVLGRFHRGLVVLTRDLEALLRRNWLRSLQLLNDVSGKSLVFHPELLELNLHLIYAPQLPELS